MPKLKACIFDLDGVIVDTAKYHYAAWRRIANELDFDFTEHENEQLKGVSRVDSLKKILSWGNVEKSEEDQAVLRERKNDWYKESIRNMTPKEILPGVADFLAQLVKNDIKLAIGSASKNTGPVLEGIGLIKMFEVIVDGNSVTKGKPNPEVFLKGCEGLKVGPEESIVFEDAFAGVEAAKAGGMIAVGVGSTKNLPNADVVIPNFQYFDFQDLQYIYKLFR